MNAVGLHRNALQWAGAPPFEQRIAGAIAMVRAGATKSAACAEHGVWRCTLRRRLAAQTKATPEDRLNAAVVMVLAGESRNHARKMCHVGNDTLRNRLRRLEALGIIREGRL